MVYQIGFSLVVPDMEDAYDLLEAASECLGDSTPEDRLPSITANRDGTFTISADICIADANSRFKLFCKVKQIMPDMVPGSSGYLRKHECGHDVGSPCSQQININWGVE